jgi:hypothetical protein
MTHWSLLADSEVTNARQHTMIWNEENCLDIAPGQHSIALNIIYDVYAEELLTIAKIVEFNV